MNFEKFIVFPNQVQWDDGNGGDVVIGIEEFEDLEKAIKKSKELK